MKVLSIFFIFFIFFNVQSKNDCASIKSHKFHRRHLSCDRTNRSIMNKAGTWLGNIVADALLMQRYLFTVESAKIVTGFVPFFLIARQIDENVQCRFYDASCHKNINQFPKSCYTIAKDGVGVPMLLLSSLMIWAPWEDVRQTARIYAIGLPFVHSGKDVIKKIRSKCCLRPWNEEFSCTKRSSGGFPSGHMAGIAYAATLFGIRHGIKWALPLSLFAGFVFADFVNCNRHYVSQLLAGAGLGVVYAFAANAVLDYHAFKNISCSSTSKVDGSSAFKVGYSF